MTKALVINKGDKYNRLTILKELERRVFKSRTNRQFLCKCDCGNIGRYVLNEIRQGKVGSCGCLASELISKRSTTHGLSSHPLYNVWSGIQERCSDKNNNRYHRYGGRGIKCKWNSLENFIKDMYPSYKKGLQIDRIDNDGNYYKQNCHWVTNQQNCRNRGNNIQYKGKILIEWAEELGVSPHLFYDRINKLGWSVKRAVETPQLRFKNKL